MADPTGPRHPLDEFLSLYWEDRRAGEVKGLREYLEVCQGDAELIASEYLTLESRLDEDDDDTVGPYRIQEEIGRGGQGVVYRAVDPRMGRTVALKVLHDLGPGAEAALERFRREARAASRADHPGVCPVYDAEVTSGVAYIAMRFVEGTTLAQCLATTNLGGDGETERDDYVDFDVLAETSLELADPATELLGAAQIRDWVSVVEKTARALHAIHEAGVVHRDIKPANIMVTREGEAVVMDFGVAREEDSDLETLTRTGDLFGTPSYMSPEQLTRHGVRLDRRTDVWSLGVVLYECLARTRPFASSSRSGLYQEILTKEPVHPREHNPAISTDLATVMARALEKDRDRRYQTAADLADELRRVLNNEPIVARPVSPGGRLLRWGRRNPALAAALSSAAVILVSGATVSLVLACSANRSAGEARDQQRRADAKASELRRTLDDWERLAEGQRLETLVAEANGPLWPAMPERASAMESWIQRASALTARLDEHRAVLQGLQSRAGPWTEDERRRDRGSRGAEQERLTELKGKLASVATALAEAGEEVRRVREDLANAEGGAGELRRRERLTQRLDTLVEDEDTLAEQKVTLTLERGQLTERMEQRLTFTFEDPRDQIRHDGLRRLVAGLERLCGPARSGSVTVQGMRSRLEFATSVRQRTVLDEAAGWTAAAGRVASTGLALPPQVGLVPLGPDPDSGLEEFAQVQSGAVPVRDPETGRLARTDETGMVFVLIPGGDFWMGAQADDPEKANHDPDALPHERPVHRVSVGPFLLSKYEMTKGQWRRFTGRAPGTYEPGFARVTLSNPVENVSWFDCRRVLQRLGLVMPSEQQWEYACRAGSSDPWSTGRTRRSLVGSVNIADQAAARVGARWPAIWAELDDGYPVHAPVGSYQPNAWGLHDMHGNVAEWCRGQATTYSASPPEDPDRQERPVGVSGRDRPQRGGSYDKGATEARSASRNRGAASTPVPNVGVRPALNLILR